VLTKFKAARPFGKNLLLTTCFIRELELIKQLTILMYRVCGVKLEIYLNPTNVHMKRISKTTYTLIYIYTRLCFLARYKGDGNC